MTVPSASPDPEALLGIALEAARAAVHIIVDERPAVLDAETKSTPTDLVTEMDRRSEAAIRAVIRAHRPHDLIVGEEGGTTHGDASGPDEERRDGADPPDDTVTWWVDPIDGTTNYVYDHPGYAVSIAAGTGATVLAGVVADPTHGRTYRATLGGGAFCDDTALRLGPPRPLEHALIATGFSYDATARREQVELLSRVIADVRDIRRVGAASLDLCAVASGRVDAYFEAGLSVWDYAAGALVATEAGAVVTSIDGGAVRPGSVLCAHPDLADTLIRTLARAAAAP